MNDVVTKETTAVTTYGDNPFSAYGDEADRAGMPLLRFNQGAWTCGGSNTEVAHGTSVLIDIAAIEIGWRKWQNQAIVETVSGKLAEGYRPSQRGELGDEDQTTWEMGLDGKTPQDPWEFFNAMPVHFPPGESPTESDVLLVGTSKGFIGAIGKLSKSYGERMRQHPDELPACELGADTYYNKTWRRDVDVPVFKVIGWSTLEQWNDGGDPPSSEPETAKARSRKAPSPTGARRNF